MAARDSSRFATPAAIVSALAAIAAAVFSYNVASDERSATFAADVRACKERLITEIDKFDRLRGAFPDPMRSERVDYTYLRTAADRISATCSFSGVLPARSPLGSSTNALGARIARDWSARATAPHAWLKTAERFKDVADAWSAILRADSAYVGALSAPPLWGDGAAALPNEVPRQPQKVLDDEGA